ncbi:MAG: ATP-dependent Clp protease adaptor ClpS [Candidatus Brocadiales bacterium]|nr:ATP-dependent Clp protease adaptor ClpS [Candidatus Brocadiales bacterium]
MTTQNNVAINVKEKIDIKPPKDFKVIYINDDATSFEFVIESLQEVFDYTYEDANSTAKKIHDEGTAVVAILPFEIAEQKGVEVLMEARQQGYPLEIKIEPAD